MEVEREKKKKIKNILIFLEISVLSILLSVFIGLETNALSIFPLRRAPHPLYAPQEVLVRFVDWASNLQIDEIFNLCGARERRRLHPTIPVFSIKLPLTNQVENTVAFLEILPLVKYAEPNFYFEAEFVPNDPIYVYQWHLGMINMETAWDIHNGAGVTVAVLDTGVAYRSAFPYAQAPDLAGTLFVPGWDFVNADAYPDDDHGHGTHIAGTIAQTTNNLYGCAGIAFGCNIMPVKVLDENSNGLLDDVVAGFYFAVDNGAQIINTSFGTVTPSLILEEAVNYATLNKVTMVCSAGNGASSAPHYPSSYLDCLSVSAIKYDQTLAFYSNYGTDIDLCAPGGSLAYDQNLDGKPDGIVQQTHNGIDFQTFDFYIFQGTSCAAAHVTGVAALIVAATGGALGPDLVKSTLASTAIDLGTVGWDQYFGSGLVNAAAALASLPLIATAASASPLQPFIPGPPAPFISFSTGAVNIPQIFSPATEWNTRWKYPQNNLIWDQRGSIYPFISFIPQASFTSNPFPGFLHGTGFGIQGPFSLSLNPLSSGMDFLQGYRAFPPFLLFL